MSQIEWKRKGRGRITCALRSFHSEAVLLQLLLTFHSPKHITCPSRRTCDCTVHTSKRRKSEYSCEHSSDCIETEDICLPQGHAPFPHPGTCHCRGVKARALTPTQDNSGEQSQLHRLSEGLAKAIIKTPSWPPHHAQILPLPWPASFTSFPKDVPRDLPSSPVVTTFPSNAGTRVWFLIGEIPHSLWPKNQNLKQK